MSFFGRAANLIKGSLKTIGRPSAEADAKARALEAELAAMEGRRDAAGRDTVERRAAEAELRALRGGSARDGGAAAGAGGGREAPAPRGPPERDENGEIKRTL